MSRLEGWWARLRPWLRRNAVERELDDEVAFHLEQEAAKLRAGGLSEAEAARAARVRFGPGTQYREEARDVWSGRLSGLGGDLRRGVRRIASRPGFAAVAILTLGLGIGANTAIFSLVKSALLRPLPYESPESLLVIWNRSGDLADDTWTSQRELVEYRKGTNVFAAIAAYTELFVNLTDGEPERVRAAFVSDDLFDVLGTPARLGRAIRPGDAVAGDQPVVVLGYGAWQRQFGGRADIIGETIRISGRPATVVGVMPEEFRLPLDYRDPRPTEIFLPDAVGTGQLAWGDRSYFLIARPAPGVTLAQASAAMVALHRQWKQQVTELADDDLDARVPTPVRDLLFRDVGRALTILFVAVGLLLLIACANVAHLLLASGDARRRELSTQAVLGASRARLVTQLLAENLVVAALGAGVGVGVGYAMVQAAMAWAPTTAIRIAGAALDPGVLAFTAAVALVATLVSGIVPALSLSRTRMTEALAAGRTIAGGGRRAPRRLLVVAETAMSLVLVLSAALLARAYAQLRAIDLGFDTRDVATLRVDLPPAEYGANGRANQFFQDALARIRAIPGVEAAGAVRVLPLSSTIGNWSITLEHRPTEPGENPNGDWQVVTPGYFEALRMQLVRGRAILPTDDESAPIAAVVSETMAARYWPGQDALGQRFRLGTLSQPWLEIVGIARDIRHNAVVEQPRAEMYIPHAQWSRATLGGPRYGMTFVVRTSGDATAVLPRLRDEVRAVDGRLPVSDLRSMDAVAAEALAEPRFTTLLLGGFAVLALLLSGVGLYGVVSFTVARRTREIGVRVALGATPMAICLLVTRDSLALTSLGVTLGLVASFWTTRLVAGEIYGISTLDPVTFAGVPAALLLVATLAAWLPAWRALRASPVEALRLE